jgi:hypothetical protein
MQRIKRVGHLPLGIRQVKHSFPLNRAIMGSISLRHIHNNKDSSISSTLSTSNNTISRDSISSSKGSTSKGNINNRDKDKDSKDKEDKEGQEGQEDQL